jgi:hypothetical protein
MLLLTFFQDYNSRGLATERHGHDGSWMDGMLAVGRVGMQETAAGQEARTEAKVNQQADC